MSDEKDEKEKLETDRLRDEVVRRMAGTPPKERLDKAKGINGKTTSKERR